MHARLPSALVAAALAVLSACGSPSPATTTTTSEGPTSSTASTSAGTSSAGTSSTGATTDTETTTTGCNFACMSDDGDGDLECDPFEQNCPEGEKCAPVDSSGDGSWDTNKCVPVTGDGTLDDPCTSNPPARGGDDCAKGYLCWFMDDGVGQCIALCGGAPEDPVCPACTQCVLAGNATLTPCLPQCDPIAPDCPAGSLCIPGPLHGFVCTLDASKDRNPVGSPCEFANACNPGLFCLSQSAFPHPGCEGSVGCCASVCDLALGAGDQNPACQALEGDVPGVECVSWHEEPPPPELCLDSEVGACIVPQP